MEKKIVTTHSWMNVEGIEKIESPALFFYYDRIIWNIEKMIEIAGKPEFLRPHVKTHKTEQIVKLQMVKGITRFKCSTIAEVEMVAYCGANDILLAFQPVGPNIQRLIRLIQKFPNQNISAIVDSEKIIHQLSANAKEAKINIRLWLDINNGMNRTGIQTGNEVVELCRLIQKLPNVELQGLHVYDGNLHEKDLSKRKKLCDEAFEPVNHLIEKLRQSGIPVQSVVAGGTPGFPIHAKRKSVETSPGTTILWDYGYATSFPDLEFLNAALVFTRVISKPGEDLLCFDLGHKAVGDDMPNPRVYLIGIKKFEVIKHNEEHLTIRTPEAINWNIGDHCFGIPYHICPTVVRYDSAYVVKDNKIMDKWKITARDRKLTI